MLVNCFATQQFDPLRYAMEDRLHQQYREHLFPFEPLIGAALKAGGRIARRHLRPAALLTACATPPP